VPLVTRYVFAADISAADTWVLLDWCLAHGADEFTQTPMKAGDEPAADDQRSIEDLRRFERAPGSRERVTTPWGEEDVRETVLWTLSPDSVSLLRSFFPDGLFQYHGAVVVEELPKTDWYEDPVFYRRGVIMLGVISHEGAALLELTAEEHAAVAALGVVTRGIPPWDPDFDDAAG
jgi:hypothetical protein